MTKKEMPLISVGMPVHNGDAYIAVALDSLLNQSHRNLEIIISDNCSTDGTGQICEEYAANDSRIRYIRQEKNIGATANFNYVLQQASSEYFMWAAHDDRWDINYVKLLLERIENDSTLSFVYGQSIFIDKNEKICGRSINNFFSFQWLRNHRNNPDVVNAIAYYLDRSPFKIYGMYRTADLREFNFKPFLGSARHADNVLLLQFLATYEAEECNKAIHYYRILPRPPEAYSETDNYVKLTHFKVEMEYFKVFVKLLWVRIHWMLLPLAPILPILLLGALVKPRAIIVKHWLFSTVPAWVRSCIQTKYF